MAQKLQQQLKEVGSKLESPPSSKDALIKLLKQATNFLSELDQSPSESLLESMQPFLGAIVRPELLKHQDRDIKLLVATCVCEITRITAPEAPYSDDVLKDIFRLIVSTFSGLSDTSGSSFSRRVFILETLARYRSCVVMLDLGSNDLVNEMFSTFFAVASDDHPENVLTSMQTIMVVLLEESEDIPEDLLIVLLSVLGRSKNGFSTAARRIAMNIIQNCAVKLEPGIKQFLISSISGDIRALSSQINYHEVIYDIYSCAPQILSGVIPYLTGELLADQLETRLKAVRLVGDLFALPGSTVFEAFQPIFSEFLKRLTDRVVEVRMSVLEHVNICLLSNPFRAEAPQIISTLCDRLLDYDENVRKQVVAVVCDVACHSPTSIPVETIKLVAERLRDKSLIVKKYTMERLAEIYKHSCLSCSDGPVKPCKFDWIPGKILRCLYDKDFRSYTIESFLCGSLFPTEFSIKDKVEQWVRLFSGFDKVENKALEKILEQKQRLQQEMQRYLSLRQMYQGSDSPELHKKVLLYFRIMSRCFCDSVKAEENFQILDQLKDTSVWKILTSLLDPKTGFVQACRFRDDLLRILGEQHQLYDFLSSLSMKCSYLLFNKEHVEELLLAVTRHKLAGSAQFTLSCMNLLVILARFSPLLFSGAEDDLVQLLKDDTEVIKEGVLHVLAKAGGSIREQLGASSSSVELILERICLEGSRRQAKYAVHALAAITKDGGLKSLSVLYKRLVDMLEEKTNLPSVLQSLGCIAQTAMPVFETRESEIEGFIKRKILECSHRVEDNKRQSWDDRSELCSLKIFGIKMLVKSYLPVKDAHLRRGIHKLLGILKDTLSFGEISKDIESSSVDKDHLRLASAKAILRLSRHWDHKIPVDVFYLTLRISETNFPQAKKSFLIKVHQYIKDRLLDPRYACVFLFSSIGSHPLEIEEDKQNLADIILMCQQAKARQLPMPSDAKSQMAYPEYLLPYIIHALAHHSSCPNVEECKDVKAFELTYRRLHLFLSMLMHGDEDGKSEASTNKEKETISTIISVLQSIKRSEDVTDTAKSKDSHAICDLGLSITKRLAGKHNDLQGLIAPVSLPQMLYKPCEKKEGDDTLVSEVMTWLADESVLTHFESLKLETNEKVQPDGVMDEVLKDSEGDGNDVPLGKMLKRLKSQGIRGKKLVKKRSSPAEANNAVNDVDILKMVREINLDNLGISSKFESTNGHERFLSKRKIDEKHPKRKREKASDATSIPVPKRRRSSSGQGVHKFSHPRRNSEGLVRTSTKTLPQAAVLLSRSTEKESELLTETGDKTFMQERVAEPAESDLLVSCFLRNSNFSSKHEDKGFNRTYDNETSKVGETDDYDLKKPVVTLETNKTKAATNLKASMVSVKKRKRRSIAGLAKCTLKEAGSHTTDLVDCRIKVWWPLDKQFYEGVVKSYDPEKKKHVVLYDDGDVEVLRLEKEQWELIDNGWEPAKVLNFQMLNSLKSHPSKQISLEQENKFFGCSEQNKNSNKMVRGKRTLRKNLKHRGRRVLERGATIQFSEAESRDAATCKVDDFNSGDSKGEQIGRMEECLTGEEVLEEEKLVPERKQLADTEKSPMDGPIEHRKPSSDREQVEDTVVGIPGNAKDPIVEVKSHSEQEVPDKSREDSGDEADKEQSSISKGNQADDAENSPDPNESGERTSDSSDSHDAEVSDNEPLGVWKRRVRRSD